MAGIPSRIRKGSRKFARSNAGLVTVEWVALAGVAVISGIAVVWPVMNDLQTPARAAGITITSCNAYAAQHHGSTNGC